MMTANRRNAENPSRAARVFGTPSQIHAELARKGRGHVFESETPGSRWCAICHHHNSVTAHAR